LPPLICKRCQQPLIRGQHVGPLFKGVHYDGPQPHPVLSKPVTIRGFIGAGGSRVDLSIGEQLRQRAAMGGERERAELAAFEKIFADALAAALVADIQREREEQVSRAGGSRGPIVSPTIS